MVVLAGLVVGGGKCIPELAGMGNYPLAWYPVASMFLTQRRNGKAERGNHSVGRTEDVVLNRRTSRMWVCSLLGVDRVVVEGSSAGCRSFWVRGVRS